MIWPWEKGLSLTASAHKASGRQWQRIMDERVAARRRLDQELKHALLADEITMDEAIRRSQAFNAR